jgi:hypothetical protein
MAGKLKGVIPDVTPSGRRYVMVSMSLAILDMVSPSCRDVILQACSTTSEMFKKKRVSNKKHIRPKKKRILFHLT